MAKRDYKREYRLFQSSTKQKKNRALRNKARREAEKRGRVRKGDNKDLHHVNGIRSSKVRVMNRSTNRAKPEKSRRKGSKRRKHK